MLSLPEGYTLSMYGIKQLSQDTQLQYYNIPQHTTLPTSCPWYHSQANTTPTRPILSAQILQ